MLEIKRMSECTIEECVEAWNKGFEGYVFDMTTTPVAFAKRAEIEDLSSDLSVVAFEDGQPVGLVRNGIRNQDGMKISWNGGTGVAASMRGKGVGKKLMQSTLEILKEAGIHRATLEAVSENHQAIELYRRMGYIITDEVHFLRLNGAVDLFLPSEDRVSIASVTPEQISELPFYRHDFPWQTQWQSVRDGEALLALDDKEKSVGYANFRKTVNGEGVHEATVLYQCETKPNALNREMIAQQLIHHVFKGFTDTISRTAVNIPVTKNKVTYEILRNLGFKVATKQVFMIKDL
ncbi:GNAT superfamily N-acetyltransferase [Planomicrobium sp. HSC-17F08]|nr:GNAT superfamily N-acetyltransferase [Planomicrobium sp. HSC-17F08]